MTNKMAEAGADAALVVTPCFYKSGMTAEALEKHFTKVNCIDKNFPKLYFPSRGEFWRLSKGICSRLQICWHSQPVLVLAVSILDYD